MKRCAIQLLVVMLITLQLILLNGCSMEEKQGENETSNESQMIDENQQVSVSESSMISVNESVEVLETTLVEAEIVDWNEVIPAPYIEILDNYYNISRNVFDTTLFSEIYDEFGDVYYNLMEVLYYEDSHMEYLLLDCNGNGSPELYIIFISNDGYYYIRHVYVLQDEEAVCCFTGWSRSRWDCVGDGRMAHFGSSGAAYSSCGYYHLDDNDNLVFENACFTDYLTEEMVYDESLYEIGLLYTENEDAHYYGDEGAIVIASGSEDVTREFEEYCNYERQEIRGEELSAYTPNYEFVPLDCTVEEAVSICEEMGGHLLVIDSVSEMERITELLRLQRMELYIYIIGAARVEEDYLWTADGSNAPADDALWRTGEPSLSGGTEDGRTVDETYTAIIYNSSEGICEMMDVPNDLIDAAPSYEGNIGFICEYD